MLCYIYPHYTSLPFLSEPFKIFPPIAQCSHSIRNSLPRLLRGGDGLVICTSASRRTAKSGVMFES